MSLCEKCSSWKVFGNKCWFYWEGKHTCTQFKKSPESEPSYASEENL